MGLSSNLDEEDERLIHKTMREDPAAKRPQHHQLNEKGRFISHTSPQFKQEFLLQIPAEVIYRLLMHFKAQFICV